MFKSLRSKQFLLLMVLSAALISMTLAAAPDSAQPGDSDEPNHGMVVNTRDEAMTEVGSGQVEPLNTEELEDLVAPVALYPDELLAIVLPAATYPIQIVLAARFLEELKNDATLQPDEAWDEPVVALLNYPEVIELLNSDLEWTWRLGEAVLNQESEVIEAIEAFRDRAVLAGNLTTDERQIVNNEGGTIKITPADPEVIYVPYYEPERVVVYQPYPVYYYYPEPYPVYYYPYPVGHHFNSGFFWGITTAFTIGWRSHHLNVHPWNNYGHPYYGHTYFSSNHYYHRPPHHDLGQRHARSGQHHGDRWQPARRHGARPRYHGLNNDHLGDNKLVATSGGSRFRRPNTFKPRPGFQGNMISAININSDDAVRRTDVRVSELKQHNAERPTRRDKTRKYNTTPKRDFVAQNQRFSGKTGRNRLDWAKDRLNINRAPLALNKSSGSRADRIVDLKSRSNKPTVPSNQGRQVNRYARSHAIRIDRPDPVSGNRSSARVTNALAYSSVRVARFSPLPRQSKRPVIQSLASRRPAPVASNPSSPSRSERGISKPQGRSGKGDRKRRIRRQ